MVLYCKKCGRQIPVSFEWEGINKTRMCDVCQSNLYEVPNEYIDNFRWRDRDGKQAVVDELVKTSPEFDQDLFDHRDEILEKKRSDLNSKLEIGKQILEEKSRVTHCPSCGSTNVGKIGTVGRMASVGLFGLASSKIGKTHKCRNCGTTW